MEETSYLDVLDLSFAQFKCKEQYESMPIAEIVSIALQNQNY